MRVYLVLQVIAVIVFSSSSAHKNSCHPDDEKCLSEPKNDTYQLSPSQEAAAQAMVIDYNSGLGLGYNGNLQSYRARAGKTKTKGRKNNNQIKRENANEPGKKKPQRVSQKPKRKMRY